MLELNRFLAPFARPDFARWAPAFPSYPVGRSEGSNGDATTQEHKNSMLAGDREPQYGVAEPRWDIPAPVAARRGRGGPSKSRFSGYGDSRPLRDRGAPSQSAPRHRHHHAPEGRPLTVEARAPAARPAREDVGVMQEAIEQRGDGGGVAE
jgi:hypothetical protein